jgi:hypothetical protein
MSYRQAISIGWSIYWRNLVWALIIICTVPIFKYFQAGSTVDPVTLVRCYVAATLAATYLVAAPYIVRRLTDISYSDFRLEVRRRDSDSKDLTYIESVILGITVNVVPSFCIGAWWGLISSLPVPAFLIPWLLTMPLTALILTGFPSRRYRLQINDGLGEL